MFYVLTAWFTSGFCIWLEMIFNDGFPSIWRSSGRQEGWARLIGFYLPLVLLFSPGLWALKIYNEIWWDRS